MLVEENPADKSGSAKASVAIDASTPLARRAGTLDQPAALSELRPGLRVSVWFVGPVAESYPVQGKAEAVLILASR